MNQPFIHQQSFNRPNLRYDVRHKAKGACLSACFARLPACVIHNTAVCA